MPEYPLTLNEAIAKNLINLELLKSIFTGIIYAVKGCHENSIAHCDIKPANIGLTKHLVPALIDFGCAYIDKPN